MLTPTSVSSSNDSYISDTNSSDRSFNIIASVECELNSIEK